MKATAAPPPATATEPRTGEVEAENQTSGLIALVAVQLCFAVFPVLVKVAYAGGAFTPYAVAAWRVMAGSAVLSLLALAVHRRRAFPPRRDLGRVIGCSLLGVALNQGLFLHGVARSTVMSAGVILCLIPIFTYAVAVLVRQERWSTMRVLGIAISLIGVAPLLLGKGAGDLAGNLMLALNSLCYSSYLVFSKPLLVRHPPLAVIAWVYLFSLPVVPYFAAGEVLVPAFHGHESAWLALGLVLLFPTVLGYLLGFFALARTRASTSAIFVYIQPVIAGLAAWLLLDERLTPGLVVTAALMFAGIRLVAR